MKTMVLPHNSEPWMAHPDRPCQWAPDAWHVKGAEQNAVARECQPCPVIAQCLAYALRTDQSHGVWGGTTERDRRAARRRLDRIKGVPRPRRIPTPERIQILDRIDGEQGDLQDALDAIGISRPSFRAWCRKNNLTDYYRRLFVRQYGHEPKDGKRLIPRKEAS